MSDHELTYSFPGLTTCEIFSAAFSPFEPKIHFGCTDADGAEASDRLLLLAAESLSSGERLEHMKHGDEL
jgi:hypothetical protein